MYLDDDRSSKITDHKSWHDAPPNWSLLDKYSQWSKRQRMLCCIQSSFKTYCLHLWHSAKISSKSRSRHAGGEAFWQLNCAKKKKKYLQHHQKQLQLLLKYFYYVSIIWRASRTNSVMISSRDYNFLGCSFRLYVLSRSCVFFVQWEDCVLLFVKIIKWQKIVETESSYFSFADITISLVSFIPPAIPPPFFFLLMEKGLHIAHFAQKSVPAGGWIQTRNPLITMPLLSNTSFSVGELSASFKAIWWAHCTHLISGVLSHSFTKVVVNRLTFTESHKLNLILGVFILDIRHSI